MEGETVNIINAMHESSCRTRSVRLGQGPAFPLEEHYAEALRWEYRTLGVGVVKRRGWGEGGRDGGPSERLCAPHLAHASQHPASICQHLPRTSIFSPSYPLGLRGTPAVLLTLRPAHPRTTPQFPIPAASSPLPHHRSPS